MEGKALPHGEVGLRRIAGAICTMPVAVFPLIRSRRRQPLVKKFRMPLQSSRTAARIAAPELLPGKFLNPPSTAGIFVYAQCGLWTMMKVESSVLYFRYRIRGPTAHARCWAASRALWSTPEAWCGIQRKGDLIDGSGRPCSLFISKLEGGLRSAAVRLPRTLINKIFLPHLGDTHQMLSIIRRDPCAVLGVESTHLPMRSTTVRHSEVYRSTMERHYFVDTSMPPRPQWRAC